MSNSSTQPCSCTICKTSFGSTGIRIKAARVSKGISGRSLAKSAGIHWSTVYRYENGVLDCPRYSVMFQLADALDVSVWWLLGSSSTPCTDPERAEFIRRYLASEAETVSPVSRR